MRGGGYFKEDNMGHKCADCGRYVNTVYRWCGNQFCYKCLAMVMLSNGITVHDINLDADEKRIVKFKQKVSDLVAKYWDDHKVEGE